jgi:hypothetical protein
LIVKLRFLIAGLGPLLWGTSPAVAAAQRLGTIGIDGVISNRAENAMGGGLTFAYVDSAFTGTLWGQKLAAKAMMLADLEIVMGALEPDVCRIPDSSGAVYYYRYCSTGEAIDYTLAEDSAPTRGYLAAYLLLDYWRARFGFGGAMHPRAGDFVLSGLVGFAASPNSWFMLELPGMPFHDWRLRIEVKLSGQDHRW